MSDETRIRLTFWNLNTVVGAVGLIASGLTAGAVLFGWGGQFNDIHRNFEAFAEWQDTWEQEAKDRRGEIERRDTAQDETIRKANETASQNSYRIAGLEARGERLERSLEDLAKQLNVQSGDIRVIREILTRIEAATKDASPPR